MCIRCRSEATGLRSGKGPALFSKLFGLRACKHTSSCLCEDCERYREKNDYADFGLFLKQEDKV